MARCSICSQLRAHYDDDLPSGTGLESSSGPGLRDGEGLLHCPECGTCYLYSTSAPGGSDDAMQTNVRERMTRVPADDGTSLGRRIKEARRARDGQ